MKNFPFCLMLSLFFVGTNQHGFVPDQPTYNCYENEPEPVNTDEAFDNYCKDYEGNIHHEHAHLTSCCECIRYECVPLGKLNEEKYYYWNKTVSEYCCLHCDGTVYKADTVIESVVEKDECGTIKTSVCRKKDEGFANIEIEFAYERCCNDEEGVLPIDTVKFEPSTCSERTCEYSFSSQHASWISNQLFHGCNCCIIDGELIPDGASWGEYECCDGRIVISVDNTTQYQTTDQTTDKTTDRTTDRTTTDQTTDRTTTDRTTSISTTKQQFDVAILIVGGLPEPQVNNSVQALDQEGNFLCDLPDIPYPYGRYGATMDGNILCGGRSNGGPANLEQNCIYYQGGSWVDPTDTLNEPRWHAVSWGRTYPPFDVDRSHIFGGNISPNTSEIAFEIGSTRNYSWPGIDGGHCSIQFENYVVIVGGGYSTSASVYDDKGFKYPLPDLVTERRYFGCGFYYKDEDLVYLVTGGLNKITLDTTELSFNEGDWSVVTSGNLPTARIGPRGVSLYNRVFMTGGWEYPNSDFNSDVLEWDIYSEQWSKRSLIEPRVYHSVSVLPWNDVEPYCIYSKKKNYSKKHFGDKMNVDGTIEH